MDRGLQEIPRNDYLVLSVRIVNVPQNAEHRNRSLVTLEHLPESLFLVAFYKVNGPSAIDRQLVRLKPHPKTSWVANNA